jgi:hypothetical protein
LEQVKADPGVQVLDAYIIEKIKREQERSDSERLPLRIEPPDSPRDRQRPSWGDDEDDDRAERGVLIIDL